MAGRDLKGCKLIPLVPMIQNAHSMGQTVGFQRKLEITNFDDIATFILARYSSFASQCCQPNVGDIVIKLSSCGLFIAGAKN